MDGLTDSCCLGRLHEMRFHFMRTILIIYLFLLYLVLYHTQSTSVVGLHLIISNGIQVKLSRGDETFNQCQEKIKQSQFEGSPVALKSTEVIRAVAVSLGSLGIIYSFTYRCIPVYNIEEERTVVRIPWP